jgi:hypothetical protein
MLQQRCTSSTACDNSNSTSQTSSERQMCIWQAHFSDVVHPLQHAADLVHDHEVHLHEPKHKACMRPVPTAASPRTLHWSAAAPSSKLVRLLAAHRVLVGVLVVAEPQREALQRARGGIRLAQSAGSATGCSTALLTSSSGRQLACCH